MTQHAGEGSYTHWVQCHQACGETWLGGCVMVPVRQEYRGHHGAHPTLMASHYYLLHHLLCLPCWVLGSHAYLQQGQEDGWEDNPWICTMGGENKYVPGREW